MNNKGVSIVALVITIIVMIIIAGIVFQSGNDNISVAQKGQFMQELETVNNALQNYNVRAVLKTPLVSGYYEQDLQWDGKSERAEHTAQLEKEGVEDTAKYIFDNSIPKILEGKIKIINGKLYVDKSYQTEYEWAIDKYKYMLSGDN